MTEDQLNHYAHFLSGNGYTTEDVLQDGLVLSFPVFDKTIKIECFFPPHFPFSFPTIRISGDSHSDCSGIPHKIIDESLCLFNPADAKPNFLNPEEQLLAAVERAKVIITDGISGKNQLDFQNEIWDYWSTMSAFQIRCFDDLPNTVASVAVKFIIESDKYGYCMIARSKSKIESLLPRVHHSAALEPPIQAGIFIPLSSGFMPNEAHDEKSIWMTILSRISHGEQKQIEAALRRISKNNSNIVVLSIPSEDKKRVFLGWKSAGVKPMQHIRYPSPFVFWAKQQEENIPIMIKGTVVLCSQNHLFYRGSYGFERRISSATVVGCGAVGSRLAEMLCTTGTEKIIAIDRECLTAENIARHICGYSYIGFPKSWLVKYRLEQHNPNIECINVVEDAFPALTNRAGEINKTNVLFVAVGELPLEAYIIKLATENVLQIPIVLTWVEPHCYAAHMVYIEQSKGVFDAIIDTKAMAYRDSVLIGDGGLIAHEPGCQSGFIPYSGLDVQQYLSRCLHELSCIRQEKQLTGNYHFTWIGELSEARRMGLKINPRHSDTPDFSFITKRID
jgi:siroheme synthase (precorrin-2 oxidase/ferrochelatase)